MSIKEIRESGLLELFAIGDLSPADESMVRAYLMEYPELKEDLVEIESALGNYAHIHRREPRPDLKNKLLKDIQSAASASPPKSPAHPGKGNFWRSIGLLAILFLLIGIIGLFVQNLEIKNLQSELAALQDRCDSLENAQSAQLAFYESFFDRGNDIVAIAPTDKYESTAILLYENKEVNKVYLQLNNLPSITDQQSFQLWSLKGTNAPIPLDVFSGNQEVLEVTFEPDTEVYAITIEPAGGSLTPNLEELIGTFSLGS